MAKLAYFQAFVKDIPVTDWLIELGFLMALSAQ